MKEENVIDTYYVGFEGYSIIQIVFESFTEKNVLKMWNGYFETLLDLMCHYESADNGTLKESYAHEGWYEGSPWEIQDLD
ncbi:hypothetical protein PAEAM_39360 [Paenibacillus sp. GM1FR]|uniref:hypothetical protein n=1 Tax=Paenibacillus sp. GM1FR TaxID=2059267 RepID=UPI000C274621|nr:hypothetical protein [Paenibacillus sp. GM1FR]PJN57723.1 hypothetical protein PAEAM_39360 [Paenibacillus sp. GM1FR]